MRSFVQKPECKSAHEIVRRTTPNASAAASRLGSARGNECSRPVLKLGRRPRFLSGGGRQHRRREEGDGNEGEEPRDVEVEPVGENELEADEERGRERGDLQLVLHPGYEID